MVNFSLWGNELLQSNESTDKMEMKENTQSTCHLGLAGLVISTKRE